jgi:methylmalonyl-CoA/ethylmalonyl-CoA epimerase
VPPPPPPPKDFGNELVFHHIGIVTHSIEITANFYVDIGYIKNNTLYDQIQDAYISFLGNPNMPRIELIEPGSDKSAVSNVLNKSGVMPYHICYSVKNIKTAISRLKTKKFILLSNPVEAIAMNNRNICFLYNKNVGLIELVEDNL